MMRVDFVFFDAGGGHRAAACALREAIERQARPMEVRLMNLQELLDEIDVFRKLTGLRLQDLYNLMLKKGWTLGSAELTAGMHAVIRLFHRRQVRLLEEYWRRSRPDMVVSLIPNFNRALCQSLRHALPGTPLVTVLTDIADTRRTSGSSLSPAASRSSVSSAARRRRWSRRRRWAMPRAKCCALPE